MCGMEYVFECVVSLYTPTYFVLVVLNSGPAEGFIWFDGLPSAKPL